MLKFRLSGIALGLISASAFVVQAADSVTQPRPVPLTRPEMKQLLEDMKVRKPRIPLPEMTAEEKERAGERGGGYESRLRSLYLSGGDRGGFGGGFGGRPNGGDRPAGGTRPGAGTPGAGGPGGAGGFGRNSDPKMTLDYAFKTQLFWIVSRTNNCQYCLGHQESKLLGAGMTEDQIAALDSDWSQFSPKEQAAYALARRITLEPHLISDTDIDAVRAHYTDLQILEMILSVAGNNQLNRWKEGVGVPQSQNGGGFGRRRPAEGEAVAKEAPPAEAKHGYLTPTAEKYQKVITKVAPLFLDEKTGEPTRQTVFRRPALESREQIEKALAAAHSRKTRLPLVDEAEARKALTASDGTDAVAPAPAVTLDDKQPLSNYLRLMANFPREGRRALQSQNAKIEEKPNDITPLLKAQISWIISRQDRAWYAVGEAKARLQKLGQTDDQIYALDGDWKNFTPAERSLFTVARKLAATPVVLTDAEVDEALKQTGPREVVQTINYTTNRASFDRITEAAGLPLEQ